MPSYALIRAASSPLTGDDAEHLDFPVRKRLRGIQVAAWLNSIVDNTFANIQLSFQAQYLAGSSFAAPVLVAIRLYQNFLTSGLAVSEFGIFIPFDLVIQPGQTLFVNSSGGGTGDYSADFILHFQE